MLQLAPLNKWFFQFIKLKAECLLHVDKYQRNLLLFTAALYPTFCYIMILNL